MPHELSILGTGRRQPKRVATTKKNSKYDDTNYLVDYSGKQNKIRKCEEGHTLDVVKQANSNYERLLVSDYTKNSKA